MADPELPDLMRQLGRLRRALKKSHQIRHRTMPAFGPKWTDPAAAAALDELLRDCDVVVFLGLLPGQLDAMFRVRLSQMMRGGPVLSARSITVLRDGQGSPPLPSGFLARARVAWPFAEADFVTLGSRLAADTAAAIGFDVPVCDAEGIAALVHGRQPATLRIEQSAPPTIALMVQPLGGRCGSTTAFENQIEELVGAGHFVLRVYLNEMESDGATMTRNWPRNVRENSVNSGAHIDAAAVMPTPHDVEPARPRSGYEQFESAIIGRYRCQILDRAVSQAASRAEIVSVNHVISIGFVLRYCPDAKMLLDTHDYFTRWAFRHALDGTGEGTFERRGELLRMARLEADLWRIPDACTNVSLSERLRVSRFNPRSVIVLPRPYVVETPEAGPEAEWDVLISCDAHAFNIGSLRWFLDTVLPRNPALRRKRIAIAGRVYQQMDVKAVEAVSNVRFLGFVNDLEALRARSRVTLVPDRAGTGIAVKTLTALAACHPVVSTDVGLRGFDEAVRRMVPGHTDGDALAQDVITLLENPALLRERREASRTAYQAILGGWSYARALAQAEAPDPAMIERRRVALARIAALATARASQLDLRSGSDREFTFRMRGSATPILAAGWHKGEVWGRWMDGPISRLSFASLARPASLTSIEIEAMAPVEPVELQLTLNGRSLGQRLIQTSSTHASYPVPEHLLTEDEPWEMVLEASRAFCAADKDPGADARVLGVGIVRLGLEPSTHYVAGTEIRAANEDADHLLRDGWHGREEWGRWMHGAESRLELFLDQPMRQPYALMLDHIPCSAGGSLALVVNGVALPARPVFDGASEWPLPRAATEGRSLLQITFRSSAVWRPSDHTSSCDSRLLGMGLRALRIDFDKARTTEPAVLAEQERDAGSLVFRIRQNIAAAWSNRPRTRR